MRTFLVVLILFSNVVSATAESLPCPLGAREDQLTLQRVMRNFGRYFRKGEAVALKGAQWPSDVTDEELTDSAEDLRLVVACADAVIASPDGELIPARIRNVPQEQKDRYVLEYVAHLQRFKLEVLNFRELIEGILATPVSDRRFQELQDKAVLINKVIDRAHGELSCMDILSSKQ